ncbi:ABC transporter [Corynebacterium kutscheri]|uniref:ABC transporter n=1 Tax=Corynebacterium kutscheri TaxID=35755 RepID=A0A0F6R1A4_9CORY|nr:ATP-binding cassette domain-containing protein [Corynebacterium kutscheri]AKE42212.1 ABC transporter [Corynebacterium kutscheri]VEH10555.1 ABC-type transporter, ATPase component [Corynebacterium kutscheri]
MIQNSLVFTGVYGHKQPVGCSSHSFECGVLYGVSGVNGSGKSTLLQTLAGEIEPLTGKVLIGDKSPGDRSCLGKIKLISTPTFIPDISIGEHFDLVFPHHKEKRLEQIETWQLEELLKVPPSWLSSGQKQRVFLALQLAASVDFLLLDEPERHLDDFWVNFLAEVLQVTAAAGSCVIVATHNSTLIRKSMQEIVLKL